MTRTASGAFLEKRRVNYVSTNSPGTPAKAKGGEAAGSWRTGEATFGAKGRVL